MSSSWWQSSSQLSLRSKSEPLLVTCLESDLFVSLLHISPSVYSSLKSVIEQGLSYCSAHVYSETWTKSTLVLSLKLSTSNVPSFALESKSIVIIGPDSQSSASKNFRSLWGASNCQLRRFANGSILESASIPNTWGPLGVLAAIIDHLASVHLNNESSLVVLPHRCTSQLIAHDVFNGSALVDVREVLQRLTHLLLDLNDEKLPMRGVRGVDCVLHSGIDLHLYRPLDKYKRSRGSKKNKCPVELNESKNALVLRPKAKITPRLSKAIEVLIDVTHRKSMGAEKFEHLRIAYLINLRKKLNSKHKAMPSIIQNGRLLLIFEHFLFSLDVERPRRLVLPEHSLNTYLQTNLALPFMDAWCGGKALIGKWITAKMLDSIVSEAVLDLLLAHCFLSPVANLEPPKTPEATFIRFLDLLSFHDFDQHDLQLNIEHPQVSDNDDLDEECSAPSPKDRPFISIPTPLDKNHYSHFTAHLSRSETQRLINVARHSLKLLVSPSKQRVLIDTIESLVMNQDLRVFDLLIHLKPLLVPRRQHKVDQDDSQSSTEVVGLDDGVMVDDDDANNEEKERRRRRLLKRKRTISVFPVVDFDPAWIYVNELKKRFDDVASFYYGKGGHVIGVRLKKERAKMLGVAEELEVLGVGLVKCVVSNMSHSEVNNSTN